MTTINSHYAHDNDSTNDFLNNAKLTRQFALRVADAFVGSVEAYAVFVVGMYLSFWFATLLIEVSVTVASVVCVAGIAQTVLVTSGTLLDNLLHGSMTKRAVSALFNRG